MPATTNYGWTEPTPGGSTDVWGTELNAMHQEIDDTVKSIDDRVVALEAATPGGGGSDSEQPLLLATSGAGRLWTADIGVMEATASASPGSLIIPLPHLRTGQQITGFSSFGISNSSTAVVQLYRMDAAGQVALISAGHFLPAGAYGLTTTSGLTHDVLADNAYFLAVTVNSGTGVVSMKYVVPTVTVP